MAGVTFTIARDNEIVTQGVSTGTDNPLCFEELDTGSYQVAQILPRNLETTTAPSTSVDVEEGSSVSLEFGSRFETAEEVANANTNDNGSTGADGDGASPTTGENGNENDNEADGDAAQDGSGVNLLAVGGLVVILVAILVLGALIFILIRQARSA
jgi:cobalamin biosynthesis Mg chelatase CobN